MAKAASAQGSLGFSGDSGRGLRRRKIGSALSAPGYAWHNLLEVGASTSAREKNPSCLSAHLPIAAETARSADSHLAPSWGLCSPDRCGPLQTSSCLWEYPSRSTS